MMRYDQSARDINVETLDGNDHEGQACMAVTEIWTRPVDGNIGVCD